MRRMVWKTSKAPMIRLMKFLDGLAISHAIRTQTGRDCIKEFNQAEIDSYSGSKRDLLIGRE